VGIDAQHQIESGEMPCATRVATLASAADNSYSCLSSFASGPITASRTQNIRQSAGAKERIARHAIDLQCSTKQRRLLAAAHDNGFRGAGLYIAIHAEAITKVLQRSLRALVAHAKHTLLYREVIVEETFSRSVSVQDAAQAVLACLSNRNPEAPKRPASGEVLHYRGGGSFL